MGVDTRVSLPGNVRVYDVARVIGILLGLPVQQADYGAAVVNGATVSGHEKIPQMASIFIKKPDGEHIAHFFYHFENAGGRRLLSARATAERIAVGRRLADFFGGAVNYNDCDEEDSDYVVPDRTDDENTPEDGAPWHDLQARILGVKPLSLAEIKRCQEYAAY